MDFQQVPVEDCDMKIVIDFNVITKSFALSGCDKNPVVALGLLDYALARVRRFLTQSDIERELKELPRVHLSNRVVS